jgi:hypothetical protein
MGQCQSILRNAFGGQPDGADDLIEGFNGLAASRHSAKS